MPDITMCLGIKSGYAIGNTNAKCPWRHKCWRFLAPANDRRQSYFQEAPGSYDEVDGFRCEHLQEFKPNE